MNLSGLNFTIAATSVGAGDPFGAYAEIFVGQVPRGVEWDLGRVLLINTKITQAPRVFVTFDRVRQVEISSAVAEIGTDFPQWEPGTYIALGGVKVYIELQHLAASYVVRGDVSGRMVTRQHFWAPRNEMRQA